uniref:Uncharacterized protein n=1 Tax=Brachypodium distachyon TaxID=15368 RepID=A0A341FU88_BRADI
MCIPFPSNERNDLISSLASTFRPADASLPRFLPRRLEHPMGSKYLLFGLCSLLVLSGQRTLFPRVLARDISVSRSETMTFVPFVHAPSKDDAGGRGIIDVDQPRVGDQKPSISPIISHFPRCPPILCHGVTKAGSATAARP